MKRVCPHCFKEIPPKHKILISERDFKKIKVGSILVSKSGLLRRVEYKSRYFIEFKKVLHNHYKDPNTTYCYNDIKTKYVIKTL